MLFVAQNKGDYCRTYWLPAGGQPWSLKCSAVRRCLCQTTALLDNRVFSRFTTSISPASAPQPLEERNEVFARLRNWWELKQRPRWLILSQTIAPQKACINAQMQKWQFDKYCRLQPCLMDFLLMAIPPYTNTCKLVHVLEWQGVHELLVSLLEQACCGYMLSDQRGCSFCVAIGIDMHAMTTHKKLVLKRWFLSWCPDQKD